MATGSDAAKGKNGEMARRAVQPVAPASRLRAGAEGGLLSVVPFGGRRQETYELTRAASGK